MCLIVIFLCCWSNEFVLIILVIGEKEKKNENLKQHNLNHLKEKASINVCLREFKKIIIIILKRKSDPKIYTQNESPCIAIFLSLIN